MRIFANTTAVAEYLPERLAKFLSCYSGISVDLQERLTRDIIRGVLDGSADLGLIAGPISAPGLEVIHYSTDRLLLAVPHGHPLTSKQHITLTQTLDFPHISLHEGSTLFDLITARAEELGRKLPTRIQVSSYDAICRMIEVGVGIGIIPESVAKGPRFGQTLTTLKLDEPWAVRERSILVRELDAMPIFVRTLIDIIKGSDEAINEKS